MAAVHPQGEVPAELSHFLKETPLGSGVCAASQLTQYFHYLSHKTWPGHSRPGVAPRSGWADSVVLGSRIRERPASRRPKELIHAEGRRTILRVFVVTSRRLPIRDRPTGLARRGLTCMSEFVAF